MIYSLSLKRILKHFQVQGGGARGIINGKGITYFPLIRSENSAIVHVHSHIIPLC